MMSSNTRKAMRSEAGQGEEMERLSGEHVIRPVHVRVAYPDVVD